MCTSQCSTYFLDRVPLSLQHAPERLPDDRELVCSVIQKDDKAIRWASGRVGDDCNIILMRKVVSKEAIWLKLASNGLQLDRKLVLRRSLLLT